MGKGYEISCSNCGHSEVFLIGVGMAYSHYENIIDYLNPGAQKRVRNIIETEIVFKTKFHEELYECQNCNTLHNRLYFKIIYGPNDDYSPIYFCGQCRKRLVLATKNIEDYLCKKCGKNTNQNVREILWD